MICVLRRLIAAAFLWNMWLAPAVVVLMVVGSAALGPVGEKLGWLTAEVYFFLILDLVVVVRTCRRGAWRDAVCSCDCLRMGRGPGSSGSTTRDIEMMNPIGSQR
jgi:hypothetical protein